MRHGRELERFWSSWRPSIHMPRWASRLTLEVTGVRIERLHEISEGDAKAEGVDSWPVWDHTVPGKPKPDDTFRNGFAKLWDEINYARAPWVSNPFVWAVSFQRVTAPAPRSSVIAPDVTQ